MNQLFQRECLIKHKKFYKSEEEYKTLEEEKIDKLIDLNLNGTISVETLREKKAKLRNKINKIEKEQEHLQLELADGVSLNQGLNKFKTLFKDNEIMPEFDKDVFELMIKKVIIGEKETNGNTNPRVITFILKSGNEIKCEDNKNQQSSYENSKNYLQKTSDTCGERGGADIKRQPVVAEFTSFQDTIMFHKRGRFGLEKVQNSEIHVKVVLDMEYGNI